METTEIVSNKVYKNLIIFIVMVVISLALITTGMITNETKRKSFVPETYYVYQESSDKNAFDGKTEYYKGENKTNPKELALYELVDDNYELSTDEVFEAETYYQKDGSEYKEVTPLVLNLNVKIEKQTKYSAGFYIYLLEIVGALVFLLSFGYLHTFLQKKYNLKKMTIKQMAVIGVFSALSIILYYFGKFNLPIFPAWLDIQFSEIPALIISFMYGPVSGILIILVRFFCKLPGTSTVGVGEMADLLIGVTLIIVAGLIYKKHKNIKGAVNALIFGMLAATVVATISNWLLLIPAYKGIAGYPQAFLTGGMDLIISGKKGVVTDDNFMVYYLFVGVVPFNLLRYSLVFTITFLLYKRLHMLINHIVGDFEEEGKFDDELKKE